MHSHPCMYRTCPGHPCGCPTPETTDPEFEPDLDDVPTAELGEYGLGYDVVHQCLGDWVTERAARGGHCVGTFLELLAARGYRVTPIDPGPPLDQLLPASPD